MTSSSIESVPLRKMDALARARSETSIPSVAVRSNAILSSHHRRSASATDSDPESLEFTQKSLKSSQESLSMDESGKYYKKSSLTRNRAALIILGLITFAAAWVLLGALGINSSFGRNEALLEISPDDWRQCHDNQHVVPRLAVIRPYIKKQIPKLTKWIRHWGESNLRPCDNQVAADLIFWYNRDLEKDPEARDQVLAALDSVPQARACFGNVYFLSANLTDEQDVYYFSIRELRFVSPGTTFMFYPLFQRKDLQEKYGYFFYMEPDTVPVRAKWLEALYTESVGAEHEFWVKGAAPSYRVGARTWYWTQEVEERHINGNAIYRLGNDCFNRMLKRVEYEYKDNPFDMATYNYRIHEAHREESREFQQRFIYSYIIQNYGTFSYSIAQTLRNWRTYFVHGIRQRE